jgi:hypothetical protein
MKKLLPSVAVVAMLIGFAANLQAQQPAEPQQPGLGERIGERVDSGLNRLGSELRRGWAEIRGGVDRLTVQGRVYSRLRWDKATTDSSIEIQVQDENVVTVIGNVRDEKTRDKVLSLTADTVGVEKVIDRLQVVPPRR